MKTYTMRIEARSADDSFWYEVSPTGTVTDDHPTFDTAQGVADHIAVNQTPADGGQLRVLVWDGVAADTSREPAAVAYSD